MTVASFNSALDAVLAWLDEANDTISKQNPVANDIESLKEQFHHHEVCLLNVSQCADLLISSHV